MRQVFRILSLVTITLGLVSQPAFADTINLTGTFSNWSVTIPFTLASPGIVDFQTAEGSEDPVLSLFDAAGNHIITVDDELTWNNFFVSAQPHLTRNLSAGNYSVFLSEFSFGLGAVLAGDVTTAPTDGFNYGTYYLGGTATLAGAVASAAALGAQYEQYETGEALPYKLTITTDVEAAPVPEPTSMLLVGSGLALAHIRRQRSKR